MEYCEKGSLSSLMKSVTLETAHKVKFALDCAMGARFLHANKIIHRDLKPDNLLVVSTNPSSQVCVKLTDFGTSRLASSDSEISMLTHSVGTPLFMAPEVVCIYYR